MFLKKGIKCVKKIVQREFSESTSHSNVYIKPKFYSDVNLLKDKEYYDFENMKLKIG
jgi:hypothetical protein